MYTVEKNLIRYCMENKVWVRLTFITASQLEGEDDLVNELSKRPNLGPGLIWLR